MNIILVRHGETEENVSRRVQGQRPGTLTPLGEKQVKDLAKQLKNKKLAAIYTSDLNRCVKTAEALHAYHKDKPLILRTELREFRFGVFEGMHVHGTNKLTVKLGVRLGQILPISLLGVDSPGAVKQRVVPFLNHIYTKHKNDTVVLVTHGGPIRVIRSIFEGIPFKTLMQERIPNCSVWNISMKKPIA